AIGGAEVSRLHANFICVRGQASAGDIFRLIDLVRDRVRRSSGVDLDLEVELWRSG
ncbi:MAG: UDP-N-acetylenolpyruvoylglucosamine reductase, partial [Planctomycetes bacterium]|nr:UDP-N-acetylenolpyruvoylglucosamine reductase [Planctomycetota bacterium]